MSTRATLDSIKSMFKGMGVAVNVVDETEGDAAEYEILVGTVTARGEEYAFDKHTLGPEGYAIKIVGNKILIAGGNDTALCTALELFMSDVLEIDEDTEELEDIVMTEKDCEEHIQTEFDITAFTIGGADIFRVQYCGK